MRIQVRLPKVEPEVYREPTACPYEGCGGRFFKRHGLRGEEKAIRDLNDDQVKSFRCRCMRCNRTFRVYPQGISRAQQSDRLKAITVLLYALGLSYGAVADFLTALAVAVSKTTVYNNVQEAGIASRSRQQAAVARGGKRAVIGSDGTYVKVKGEKVGVQVVVDDQSGDLLGIVCSADLVFCIGHKRIRYAKGGYDGWFQEAESTGVSDVIGNSRGWRAGGRVRTPDGHHRERKDRCGRERSDRQGDGCRRERSDRQGDGCRRKGQGGGRTGRAP
jgi:hypothetical protein